MVLWAGGGWKLVDPNEPPLPDVPAACFRKAERLGVEWLRGPRAGEAGCGQPVFCQDFSQAPEFDGADASWMGRGVGNATLSSLGVEKR